MHWEMLFFRSIKKFKEEVRKMNNEKMNGANMFATEPIGKLIAKFAIPCVVSLLVSALYNIVDQIFIGRGVGYLGNGATNVVFPITVIALAFALLIGDGGAAFLSLKLGENDTKAATKGVGNAMTMITITGILMLAVTMMTLESAVRGFGATDALMPYAMPYGRIIALGLPFTMISTALNSIIRADGNPQFAMASMLLGALINTILDPIFIFAFHMGVEGAAIATVLGQVASFVLSVIYVKRFKTVKITVEALKLDLKVSRRILGYGVSSFITQISITIVMAVTNNLLASFGAKSIYGAEIPLTAMGIVMKVNQILISIMVGIAAGSQPIIGYNYGAGNHKRVKETLFIAVGLAEFVAVIACIIFQRFPMSLVSLFGSEEGLYNEFAVKCFKIFLLLCVFNGFQTVSGIYLQAVGKPIKAAIVSLSRQIVFLIPAAVIMANIIGVEGVLWSGPIADTLAFILSLALMTFEVVSLKKAEVVQLKKSEAHANI